MLDETHATATVEEYLEAILNMASEGKKALAARLAERLQVSPPTVTVTLQRMGRDGLVAANERKEINLTEKGWRGCIMLWGSLRLAHTATPSP